MIVTGGLAWWNDFIVLACYNISDRSTIVWKSNGLAQNPKRRAAYKTGPPPLEDEASG